MSAAPNLSKTWMRVHLRKKLVVTHVFRKKTPPAGVPKWLTQASGSPAYDTLASQSDLELDNTSEDSDS